MMLVSLEVEGAAVGAAIDGMPLAITMLVTSWVTIGLPMVAGSGAAIVDGVVAGWIVAVMTLAVLGIAPGTVSQIL